MLKTVRTFVELCSRRLPLTGPCVEFGARQVPGQESIADLRGLFPGQQYVGTDMAPGRGVDATMDLRALALGKGSVRTALILDTLEHVADPWAALREIHHALHEDGWLIMSTPFRIPIHGHPDDYWRFTPSAIHLLLQDFAWRHVVSVGREDFPVTVLTLARHRAPEDEVFTPFAEALERHREKWARIERAMEEGRVQVDSI